MAFNKMRSVSLETQQRSRKTRKKNLLPTMRYNSCKVMRDGDIKRLTFKRYTQHNIPYTQGKRGEVPLERQHRPDLIAHKIYGDPKMYWAICTFNRGISLNPIRLEVGSVIVLPFTELVEKWLSNTIL